MGRLGGKMSKLKCTSSYSYGAACGQLLLTLASNSVAISCIVRVPAVL